MKQRVLLVNKFYYRRGGDCVCVLNLEQLLRAQGHEVAVFAMQYPENLPNEWSSYWPSEVSFAGGASAKLRAAARTFGLGNVKRCFDRLLKDFRPDVVHLHNIHSYISPAVAAMARRAGARVVWTLHDYKLLCPSYACLRQSKPCELCFSGKLPVLTNRCMKGSLAASAVAFLEAERWNARLLTRITDAFICPSGFMARKMEQGGFPPAKLLTLCNFLPDESARRFRELLDGGNAATREPSYCYVGRLSPEKGVETLLEAAAKLPYTLNVAGDGPLATELRSRYADCANIRFLGQLSGPEVVNLLSRSTLSVTPSECYENNPNSVIESLCAGTPVVGAEIGGIPELIDAASGITFPSGNVEQLRHALDAAMKHTWNHQAIAETSLQRFSASAYNRSLTRIYS
ncbi:MAG: glycosyltransferase family 4 protein [Firmicutes bacterium]|nr:glycosyltransferase family 4 protein [Bacillota bacterium]MCM1402014.1 glycosyltransferase family 4 protein [Bacteroides sp.]MCM1477928.1 glycosyltransferase family 4 protein [Bacteroides sp.]